MTTMARVIACKWYPGIPIPEPYNQIVRTPPSPIVLVGSHAFVPAYPPPRRVSKRNRTIIRRVKAGETLEAVGAAYGISKQRVHQIVTRGLGDLVEKPKDWSEG